jgi:hypothetical protein
MQPAMPQAVLAHTIKNAKRLGFGRAVGVAVDVEIIGFDSLLFGNCRNLVLHDFKVRSWPISAVQRIYS